MILWILELKVRHKDCGSVHRVLDKKFVSRFSEVYIGAVMRIKIDIISKEGGGWVIVLHESPLRVGNVGCCSWRVVRNLGREYSETHKLPALRSNEQVRQSGCQQTQRFHPKLD